MSKQVDWKRWHPEMRKARRSVTHRICYWYYRAAGYIRYVLPLDLAIVAQLVIRFVRTN